MSLAELHAALGTALGAFGNRLVLEGDTLRLTASVSGVSLAELIGTALGRPEMAPAWLPAELHLDVFTLSLDDEGEPVVAITLRFGGAADAAAGAATAKAAGKVPTPAASAEGWRPFDGITMMQGTIEFSEADGRMSGVLSGEAVFDSLPKLRLNAELSLPGQLFSIELHPDAELDAGADVFDQLGLASTGSASAPATARTPQLLDLSLSGSMIHGRFVIHVEAADLLDLKLLTIDRVAADVGIGGGTSICVYTAATVHAGGEIHFDLLGQVGPEGWRMVGAARFDSPPTIGELARALAVRAGADEPRLPPIIDKLGIAAIDLTVDTVQDLLAFHCTLAWEGGPRLDVRIEHRAGALDVSGVLHLGGVEFMVAFDKSGAGNLLVGAFSAPAGLDVSVGRLLAALDPGAGTQDDGPHFSLQDALVAYRSHDAGANKKADVLVAADMGLGFDIAAFRGLPVLGALLPAGDTLKLAFGVGYARWQGSPANDIPAQALPPGITLPAQDGMSFAAQLKIGDTVTPLAFPPRTAYDDNRPQAATLSTASAASTAVVVPKAAAATPAAAAPALTWHALGRAFGPVRVDRLGLGWDAAKSEVVVVLDASIGFSGLTISLQGFGARYRLSDHHLAVTLAGLGLDLKSGAVEIGGAFLNVDGDYAGALTIRSGKLAINAIGAFTMLDGEPSMFAYAYIDYPIGGPAFFYVEGLAVGFAYNRELVLPALDAVRTFPLVADAIGAGAGSAAPAGDPATQLRRIHDFVRPALGQNFIALGVKFNSFKLLDSFALLTVSFGARPEVAIIGSSTYQSPPGALGDLPALVHVGLDLIGRMPLDGELLAIDAKLTQGSYLYNTNCSLSGGFAFHSWFTGPHAGTFVLSIGGYHPDFHPEQQTPCFPAVQPLQIAYQVTSDIFIKGSAYLALTPSMIMAGCAVQASASIGSLEAGFSMEVDFLMGWEPYHYEFHAGLSIYAKWGWFSTHASASLTIGGPAFGGTAHVDWSVFSFDVDFGSRGSSGPVPITWQAFADKFLPDPAKLCSVQAVGGVVATVGTAGTDQRWIINAKAFALSVSTAVPATGAGFATSMQDRTADFPLGIAPMNRLDKVSSTLTVTVTLDGDVPVSDRFVVELVERKFPAAQWGRVFQPVEPGKGTPAPAMVNAIGGLVIRPAGEVVKGQVATRRFGAADTQARIPAWDAPVDALDQGLTCMEMRDDEREPFRQRFLRQKDLLRLEPDVLDEALDDELRDVLMTGLLQDLGLGPGEIRIGADFPQRGRAARAKGTVHA